MRVNLESIIKIANTNIHNLDLYYKGREIKVDKDFIEWTKTASRGKVDIFEYLQNIIYLERLNDEDAT